MWISKIVKGSLGSSFFTVSEGILGEAPVRVEFVEALGFEAIGVSNSLVLGRDLNFFGVRCLVPGVTRIGRANVVNA